LYTWAPAMARAVPARVAATSRAGRGPGAANAIPTQVVRVDGSTWRGLVRAMESRREVVVPVARTAVVATGFRLSSVSIPRPCPALPEGQSTEAAVRTGPVYRSVQ